MLEDLSLGELPGGWERNPDDSSVVASHDSGAELTVWKAGRVWVANLVQTVESDNYRATVATHAADFSETMDNAKQELRAYVNELLTGFDSGEHVVEAVAIVGHDGDVGSVNIDSLDDGPLIDPDETPPLADVLVIYPDKLPRNVGMSDVRDVRCELVAAVYGDMDSFDALRVLESKNEAYGGVTAEIFSVSEHSLESLSQNDD